VHPAGELKPNPSIRRALKLRSTETRHAAIASCEGDSYHRVESEIRPLQGGIFHLFRAHQGIALG